MQTNKNKNSENASRNIPYCVSQLLMMNHKNQRNITSLIFYSSAIDEIQDYFDEDINDLPLFNKIRLE